MHVRDQLSNVRPLARAAALGRQATHARRARPAVLRGDARTDSLACLFATPEQQRQWLCRELHDGLGPTLAGLTLGLDTAHALSAGQPDLRQLLGRLKTETQRAVAELRRIAYGRPPLLELGLAGALREEVLRLQCEAPELAISLAVPRDGLAGLPAPVELACYRIVAEALANVARHAHARRCSVRLHLDRAVCVDVHDDGVGLAEGWRPGVGIASMRERVTELGGELVIEPGLPRGTRIAARLPVREQP
jgi:signal transduction histidine kinase